jgi:hypothetical membrane protein
VADDRTRSAPERRAWSSRRHAPSRWHQRSGAWAWTLVAPVFLTLQLVVGSAWDGGYSWADNNLSDLGNVRCGPWGPDERYVCSPLHDLMNTTFVATGLLVLAGVVLLWRCDLLGGSRAGRLLLGLAGAGYVVVGLAPADVHEDVHVVLGAVPVFFAGNLALLLLAAGRGPVLRLVRLAGLVSGVAGLAGSVLFLQHRYLGLGMGGMERVAALPLHVFLLVTGLALHWRWRGRG